MSGTVFEYRVGQGATGVVIAAFSISFLAIVLVPLRLSKARANELVNEGIAVAKSGDYERAERLLEEALKEDPTNAEYAYNLGQIYLRDGGPVADKACPTLYKAAQLKPADAEFRVEYGRCLALVNRPGDAIESLKHAAALGFCDRTRLANEPAFRNLQPLSAFQEVLGTISSRCGK